MKVDLIFRPTVQKILNWVIVVIGNSTKSQKPGFERQGLGFRVYKPGICKLGDKFTLGLTYIRHTNPIDLWVLLSQVFCITPTPQQKASKLSFSMYAYLNKAKCYFVTSTRSLIYMHPPTRTSIML
jgi:hypothetical protein